MALFTLIFIVLLAAKGREAAKRAKDLVKRKDSMSVGTLPGNFLPFAI
jgi:DNA gyrase/topoisomerase IV subunit B